MVPWKSCARAAGMAAAPLDAGARHRLQRLEATVPLTDRLGHRLSNAQDLIAGVLNGAAPRLTEDLALGHIPGWDSVTMVRLVVAMEERLDRQLSDVELEAIETVGDVDKLLKARRQL